MSSKEEAFYHPCPRQEVDSPRAAARRRRWEEIAPAAVCISLQEREDRMQEAAAQFQRVGLDDLVSFYRPPRDTTKIRRPGTRGCWESHRAVATWAYKAGLTHVMVFEDDVEFTDPFRATEFRTIRDGLAMLPANWRILYLGHFSLAAVPIPGTPLRRTVSGCLHAYIMSRHLMKWMMNSSWEDKTMHGKCPLGIDSYVALLPGGYAVAPMVCFQSGSTSDNGRNCNVGDGLVKWMNSKKGLQTSERFSVWIPYLLMALVIGYLVLHRMAAARKRGKCAAFA